MTALSDGMVPTQKVINKFILSKESTYRVYKAFYYDFVYYVKHLSVQFHANMEYKQSGVEQP